MIYICVYMLRVLSEVYHTYLCECLARGMTAFFYVYIHQINSFIVHVKHIMIMLL